MSDFVHGEANEKQHNHVHDHDLEAGSTDKGTRVLEGDSGSDSAEIIKAREIRQNVGVLRKLREGEEWLDRKMGVETQGVDRIHEEDKQPPSIFNAFFLWCSLTLHVGTLPIGILGPDFGLTFNQSVSAIVVGTATGALCTCYTGTLGPKLGLRAIATSRYSFGFWGAKLASVLNVIIGAGFAVVNVVVVGQILSAVSDYKMTVSVGCVIIAVIGYVVSIFGFSIIHTYEKYSWIMSFILTLILVGEMGGKMDTSIPTYLSGIGLAGTWLSFYAICFSSASGWCSMASDYYCNYPASTPSWKIFVLTFFGITIPTSFVTIVGACLGNAAITNGEVNTVFADAYDDHGIGGLLLEAYHPMGFSKLCLVLLVFTVIGNNVAVNYSSGLSMQLLGHYFHAIPRFIWSFINALVVAILAIAGKDSLSAILSDFVSLLGYWTVSFSIILLIEDQWFRRNTGYDLNVWDVASKLPPGFAAILALLVGYLAGGLPGMAQNWYIGPIALKFGPYGGDVGIFLSGAFTLVVYPIARWLEIKKFGR